MRPIRTGMIGLGVISRYYLEAFRPGESLELVAACDRDTAKLAPFRRGGIATHDDYAAMLRNPDIDAVVINLPNDLHFPACRDALVAGKHVCCEKPLTLSPGETEALVAASKAARRTLFTAFHRSYNANYTRLLAQVPGPSSVARVEAWYLERIEDHAGNDLWYMDPARSGGGCIADNGPNVFDMLTGLMGRLLEVTGVEVERWSGPTEMEARVDLANSRGATAKVHLDWGYAHGESKGLAVELMNGRRFTVDLLDGFPDFKGSLPHEYVAILRDFAAHVARGEGRGEAGADAVRLVADAYRMVRTHAEVAHA